MLGFGRILLNPNQSGWDLTRSSLILLDFSQFLNSPVGFRLLGVLEKQTRHSIGWRQFLELETRHRPTGASVRVEIRSMSGGLVYFSGSNRGWTPLAIVTQTLLINCSWSSANVPMMWQFFLRFGLSVYGLRVLNGWISLIAFLDLLFLYPKCLAKVLIWIKWS